MKPMKKQIVALAVLAIPLAACGTVQSGEVGLWKTWGQVGKNQVDPGVHGFWPVGTELVTMDVKSQKVDGKTAAYTKDLQTANISYTIVLSLQRGHAYDILTTVGPDWNERLVPPLVESLVKDVFGQFNANESVGERPKMQAEMFNAVKARLAIRGISVENFVITNIDYSDEFEKAVERAQVATQNAVAAQNHTVEVTEQAKQTTITAEAEANRIRVQAAAISANPAIVQLRWVEKWDGTMPSTVYCAATMPCLQGSN